MIQSDCGLVLWPICLISSATSAGLLSEHAPLQRVHLKKPVKKTHKKFFLKTRNHGGQGFSSSKEWEAR